MNAPAFKKLWTQIPLEQGAPGASKSLALLKPGPAELSRRTGIRFDETEDDLDKMKLAIVKTRSGRAFVLLRYCNEPAPGTHVLAKSKKSEAGTFVADLLHGLGLRPEDVLESSAASR